LLLFSFLDLSFAGLTRSSGRHSYSEVLERGVHLARALNLKLTVRGLGVTLGNAQLQQDQQGFGQIIVRLLLEDSAKPNPIW
jgi:hypothetical protein